jgi:hypothetical protein
VTRPPGLRAYVAVIGALAVAAAVVAVVWLASDSRRYAATNSAAPRAWATSVEAGHRLCVTRLWMPAGSDSVRMRLATLGKGPTRVELTLATPEGARRSSGFVSAERGQDLDFPMRPLRRSGPARLCLRPEHLLGGVSGTPFLENSVTGPTSELDGAPTPHQISVFFLEPRERSLASALPDALRRAPLFRAGFVGSWTYVALLPLLLLLWLLGLRALTRGRR